MIAEYMRGSRGRDYMVVGYLQLPVQSASINCIVVSSNPVSWRGILDTTLSDKVCQETCGMSVVFFGYSGFLHQ
jgi:hypothetical protein